MKSKRGKVTSNHRVTIPKPFYKALNLDISNEVEIIMGDGELILRPVKEDIDILGFCESCHDNVNYFTKEEKKIKNIKGKRYEYVGKEAYCKVCGSPVFSSVVRDYNLGVLESIFRKTD